VRKVALSAFREAMRSKVNSFDMEKLPPISTQEDQRLLFFTISSGLFKQVSNPSFSVSFMLGQKRAPSLLKREPETNVNRRLCICRL
jgi:hypothetical protein